jgi:hypothetical protein
MDDTGLLQTRSSHVSTINLNHSPADLLPGVIAAVDETGTLIRAETNRLGGPRTCGGKAPVDEEAERLLKTRLLALSPCGWHGEETGADPIGAGDTWVVDPQDGTSDFLKGAGPPCRSRSCAIADPSLAWFMPHRRRTIAAT